MPPRSTPTGVPPRCRSSAGSPTRSSSWGARLDRAATGCATRLQVGLDPPPAALVLEHSVAGAHFAFDVLWDHRSAETFAALPGADARSRTLPIDPWVLEALEAFLRDHDVEVGASAAPALRGLRDEYDVAIEAIRRSRSRTAEPPDPAPRLGEGELAPFQWAGVRYVLDARRVFLADEQGLGKTVAGPGRAGGRCGVPRGRRLPGEPEAQLGARGRTLAAPPHPHDRQRPGRRPGPRRHHDRQLRHRRRSRRGAAARRAPRAGAGRVALRQEPARSAHAGGPLAGGPSAGGSPASGADRHARDQPRRTTSSPSCESWAVWRSSAAARASAGAFRAWAARSGCTGTCVARAS